MKTIRTFVLFFITVSFLGADDWESHELVNLLLNIKEPNPPVVHENSVIFTADSSIQRIGVSFAHENFSTVYWFRRLFIPQEFLNPVILPGQKVPDPFKDSGIQFHVYQVPDNLLEVEYRLVINGLWTIDPANPRTRRDPVTGLTMSVLNIPSRPENYHPSSGLPDGLKFSFKGPPGEIVTVAGNFNGWDPFMYELKESPSGHYSLTLPLPPGKYQYVFIHRGQRFTDPHNPRRIYARDGNAASEVVIQ